MISVTVLDPSNPSSLLGVDVAEAQAGNRGLRGVPSTIESLKVCSVIIHSGLTFMHTYVIRVATRPRCILSESCTMGTKSA